MDFNSSIINVTFIPGQVEATFQVQIIDDSIAEDTEMCIAVLSTDATNIRFGGDVATVTIKDNDSKATRLLMLLAISSMLAQCRKHFVARRAPM